VDLRFNNPDAEADAQEAAGPDAPDVRGDTFTRIRKSLVTSRLTLASDAAGGDPYDSRRGRTPGSVWGHRRR
jgi:hypothetical protein